MIGPTKLTAIRAEVRKRFKMSDAELLAWFNENLEKLRSKTDADSVEIETLELLRDGLIKEARRGRSKPRKPRVTSRSKG